MNTNAPGIHPRNNCTKFYQKQTIFEDSRLPQSFLTDRQTFLNFSSIEVENSLYDRACLFHFFDNLLNNFSQIRVHVKLKNKMHFSIFHTKACQKGSSKTKTKTRIYQEK